jgi:hypothetical protein
MPRLFVHDHSFQLCKSGHHHCGDAVFVARRQDSTIAILADGIGSGIEARVAATLAGEYLLSLINEGSTSSEAVRALLRSLRRARLHNGPWAALNAVFIGSSGEATAYSYESPEPFIMTARGLESLAFQPHHWDGEVVQEVSTHLRPSEGLLLFSDGVTQAGLGRGLPRGWGTAGIKSFLSNARLDSPSAAAAIPAALAREAASLNDNRPIDDITVLALVLRKPRILHLLTGPPRQRNDTEKVMASFLAQEGVKVVCGGTTTQLLAKHMGVMPQVVPGQYGAPAHYEMDGVALACEGTVTLNRVNNVFDDPDLADEAGYGAARLLRLLCEADEVHFWVGQAANPAHSSSLKPSGILARNEVVAELVDKLRRAGKLAVVRKT